MYVRPVYMSIVQVGCLVLVSFHWKYMPRSELYAMHNVIRSVSISAKFGICSVVGLNGTLVEGKIHTWGHLNVRILASKSALFRLRKVQVPNLAKTHTKQFTVLHCVNMACRRSCWWTTVTTTLAWAPSWPPSTRSN